MPLGIVKPLGDHELYLLLVQFAVLLATARLLGEGAKRVGLPSVVGELLAGFALGPTLSGNIAPDLFKATFPQQPEQVHLLEVVAWLGVIMLLILTGLETDSGLIARKGRGAAAISLGGIAVPFVSGVALGPCHSGRVSGPARQAPGVGIVHRHGHEHLCHSCHRQGPHGDAHHPA
jgi:Kef-type K+ transport system membrane component KefB